MRTFRKSALQEHCEPRAHCDERFMGRILTWTALAGGTLLLGLAGWLLSGL
jgi:hypothetical protein